MKNELITIKNGVPITTSLHIALDFHINHKDLLSLIGRLPVSKDFHAKNFNVTDFKDFSGATKPIYEITKDGFSFVAMRFESESEAQTQESYITAFNAVEKSLIDKQYNYLISVLKIQSDALKQRTPEKSPQDLFIRNHKAACLLFNDRDSRLNYANEVTKAATGNDVLKQAGVRLTKDNTALLSLLKQEINGRTVKELLDSVHYRHEGCYISEKVLMSVYLKLYHGRLHIGNKCKLVDFKGLQSINDATFNVPVSFNETCKATVIQLYDMPVNSLS